MRCCGKTALIWTVAVAAVATMRLPSASGQALRPTLEELDGRALETMRARLECDRNSGRDRKLVCEGLRLFAGGQSPRGLDLDGRRLIGMGAEVSAQGDVRLEVDVFQYLLTRDFHAAVELGDQVAVGNVIPENPEEQQDSAAAARRIAKGFPADGNSAYEYARTMPVEYMPTQLTNGRSTGADNGNRLLIRQNGKTVVVVEVPMENSQVRSNKFYVMIFRAK